MKQHHQPLIIALSLAFAFPAAQAGDPDLSGAPTPHEVADKRSYHLFNPTPPELLRELSPDRPDATESPLTVDAGHFVFEVSLFDWRHDGGDDAYTLMSTNFKVGLTNRTDLQFVFDAYSWERPESSDAAEGFGDIQLRLKQNLWGNDEGDSALALFPYVKIPTGTELSNDEWEGGLIVPFSTQLTDRVGLGLMAELDVVYDDEIHDHELKFLHSAVLGIDVTERFGTFVEYVGISGDTNYEAYGAGGFTFSVNQDFVLDCGLQVGLNDSAEELGIFAGFTRRF
jgi:hypothetical protein